MSQGAAGFNILSNNVQLSGWNLSAFGDLATAEIEPLIQLDFFYGINIQTGVSTTANSATVDTNASRLQLQTGTNSAGSAIFSSKRPAKYRTGQCVNALTVDLTAQEIFLVPGDRLTFSMLGNAATTGVVAVNWSEDI